MGGSFSSCTRADSVQLSPTNKKSVSIRDDEISELSVDMRPPARDKEISTKVPEVDLSKALDQIFLLCETGIAATIQFIFDSHPGVEMLINERKTCHIADTSMELTPLQLAAACGHGEAIKTVCSNHHTLVNVADPVFSMTALHLAVHLGQIFAVEALCKDNRVEVDEKTVEGKTAMHIAVSHEYSGIVETILRLHPNIDLRIKDFDGNNVFHLAAIHPNVKIMTLLANHASLVNLYCDYFDVTKLSAKNRPKSKKQIFEVVNYNGKTAAGILSDAIKSVQKRRAEMEKRLAQEETKQVAIFSAGLREALAASDTLPVELVQPPITSGATTEERSEGSLLISPLVPTDPCANAFSTVSSVDSSPTPEDLDLDTLIQCLEIIQSVVQVSPSTRSFTSFGDHSTTGDRKCSFDLDSNASQAGEPQEEDEELLEMQERAAYSWSPPFTPSLDQPDPYFTPMSSNSD